MTNMNMRQGQKVIPVHPNLFTIPSSPEEKAHLLASKCKHCGETMFPSQKTCPNCSSIELDIIKLDRRGRIVKSTVLRHPPQLYKGTIPYVIAEVELPGGVPVPTIIRGWDADTAPPYGLEVELDLEKFEVDDAGNEVLMYIFRPL
ncbi:Zn-ribbon domain-containing OB-fold protein [Chloroflexota bacterium]